MDQIGRKMAPKAIVAAVCSILMCPFFSLSCRSPLSDGTSRIRNWLRVTLRVSFSFGSSTRVDGPLNLSTIEVHPLFVSHGHMMEEWLLFAIRYVCMFVCL